MINGIKFQHFQLDYFQKYPFIDSSTTYFESFQDNHYTLMNAQKEVVHHIPFAIGEQSATLFGKKYIVINSTENNVSFDEHLVTLMKCAAKEDSNIYVLFYPSFGISLLHVNGSMFTKNMIADFFYKISASLEEKKTKYPKEKSLVAGDELQVLYRKKDYNKNGTAVYTNRSVITYRVMKDTLINEEACYIINQSSYKWSTNETEILSPLILRKNNNPLFVKKRKKIKFEDICKLEVVNPLELNISVPSSTILGSKSLVTLLEHQSSKLTLTTTLSSFPIFIIETEGLEAKIQYLKKRSKTWGEKLIF